MLPHLHCPLQLLVEKYFTSLTSSTYYIGLNRTGSNPWKHINNGTTLASPQTLSTGSPFRHWWHTSEARWAADTNLGCVSAFNNVRWCKFTGDATIAADRSNSSKYLTNCCDLLNGWGPNTCNVTLPSVCMIPATSLRCHPPPTPPPRPPPPPSPPLPPAPPICEWPGCASSAKKASQRGKQAWNVMQTRPWLALHTGAPLPTTTFYCHATNQLCYWLRGTNTNNNGATKTFTDASYECKGLNGELVIYASKREQLNVERYFGAQLPTTYWVGYARQSAPPNSIPTWVGVDGTAVDQYPNNTSPYAHWSWNHYTR